MQCLWVDYGLCILAELCWELACCLQGLPNQVSRFGQMSVNSNILIVFDIGSFLVQWVVLVVAKGRITFCFSGVVVQILNIHPVIFRLNQCKLLWFGCRWYFPIILYMHFRYGSCGVAGASWHPSTVLTWLDGLVSELAWHSCPYHQLEMVPWQTKNDDLMYSAVADLLFMCSAVFNDNSIMTECSFCFWTKLAGQLTGDSFSSFKLCQSCTEGKQQHLSCYAIMWRKLLLVQAGLLNRCGN